MSDRAQKILTAALLALVTAAAVVVETVDPSYPRQAPAVTVEHSPAAPEPAESVTAQPEPVEPEPEPYVEPESAAVEPEPYVEPRVPSYIPVVLTPTPYATRDQSVVDSGALVTWLDDAGPLPCLLAGHDHMGWDWIDDIPVGTYLDVTQGPCAGAWVVVENRWGPTSPDVHDWMWNYTGYLALQTCEAGGYGYSIARRA